MFSEQLENSDVATRRDDPNFSQVSGYIPKEKALNFKIACTALQITQSDALDEAISLWLENHEQPSSTPKREKGKDTT
ncbi:hypothetical protein H6G80_32695 [Nostoc sp. FACHB-87]|uniref:hypothetical protein n=1 Tax=Nostocaceae TaxID=1162 RepID=UPI0016829616|nr:MULTISPECIES: hypothetical protein [Nostocaceae]MBD2458804.1 hypothetical protein [Nostoc sp. FACHB-87]MBD2480179.1 hypothetical protein [Anabaena sp. FACHB-83]